MTAGLPQAQSPARAGLLFSNRREHLAMLAAIGPHTYTDVQWSVTTHVSYRRVVRPTERLPQLPPTPPPFGFHDDLRYPHPPMTLRAS